MNVLNTIQAVALKASAWVAQATTPKGEEPGWKLFGEDGIFQWWQVLLFLVMVGLVVFLIIYRKKQASDD